MTMVRLAANGCSEPYVLNAAELTNGCLTARFGPIARPSNVLLFLDIDRKAGMTTDTRGLTTPTSRPID